MHSLFPWDTRRARYSSPPPLHSPDAPAPSRRIAAIKRALNYSRRYYRRRCGVSGETGFEMKTRAISRAGSRRGSVPARTAVADNAFRIDKIFTREDPSARRQPRLGWIDRSIGIPRGSISRRERIARLYVKLPADRLIRMDTNQHGKRKKKKEVQKQKWERGKWRTCGIALLQYSVTF